MPTKHTATAAGLLFLAAFFALTQTDSGMRITFGAPFTRLAPGEVLFWLAHALLVVPGAALVGYGFGPRVGNALRQAHGWLEGLRRPQLGTLLVGVFILLVAVYALARSAFLLGLPITDDEASARFGGRVLAGGAVEIPAPPLINRLPNTYLYDDGAGHVTSVDWLGAQVAWAAAELSRLGSLVFTFLAAVPALLVGVLMSRLRTRTLGAAAAVLFVFSPMAFSLSMTTHAHLVSRTFLAGTLCLYAFARERPGKGRWSAVGLCLGGGFLTRPVETAALLTPLAVWHLIEGFRRDKTLLSGAAWIAAGLVPAAVLFLAHNARVTGNALLPARWDNGATAEAQDKLWGNGDLLWHRFGINTGFNALMLAVWFFGPLGVILVTAGARASAFTKALGLGVVCALAVGLLHEDTGLHSVGPIHYSETAVPLTILAAYGLERIWTLLSRIGLSRGSWASALAGTVVLGGSLFILWNGLALRRSAAIQTTLYSVVQDPSLPRCAVLAPYFGELWLQIPAFARVGSWVYGWRPPHPDLSDRVLLVHDRLHQEEDVRLAFPDRVLYRVEKQERPPYIHLVEVN